MKGLRVLVCGGRHYNHRRVLFEVLDNLVIERGPIEVVIHGNASGADALADSWAKMRNVTSIPVQAEWYKHGKAAGPIRNRRMITEHAPDLVVAFPGGDGTGNMIGLAKKADIEVVIIS